jgi:hypothetical protein
MTRNDTSHATDVWYESEEPTRVGMKAEIQRIARRTRARPIPVLLLATLVTGLITFRFATHRAPLEAESVLALTEGSLSTHRTTIPVDQLRAYVTSVLMPDAKLLELIERRDLYPSRRKLGNDYALEELRGEIEVQIWKNEFIAFDDGTPVSRSARIGITYADVDPDLAIGIAHDLAGVVISAAAEQRRAVADGVAAEVTLFREGVTRQLADLAAETSAKEVALEEARKANDTKRVAALELELGNLARDHKRATTQLTSAATTQDAIADRISAAGLDMSVDVVEEHRPERPEHSSFVLIMIACVVGVVALIGSALVLGAFDARVHDTDDVARLGLPVLGHVPGFAGDHVGSLAARGALRGRVPSFLRWRFLR